MRRNSKPPGHLRNHARWLVAVPFMLASVFTATTDVCAQSPGERTMPRNGWRWQPSESRGIYSGSRTYSSGGLGYVTPLYYGWGHPYFNYGIPIIDWNMGYETESSVWARSQAAKAQARAAVDYEKARQEYIKNQAEYIRLRREHQQRLAEQRAEERAKRIEKASRTPPRKPTDMYSRLSAAELDASTGTISWPQSLLSTEFDDLRLEIEQLVKKHSVGRVTEADAKSLRDLCNKMKEATNPIIQREGFATYSAARRFLGQLSVEGYYVLEEQ